MSIQVHPGGMAGLGVGLLSVAVAAGYTGQTALEAICALFGVIAVIAYMAMAIDRARVP